METKTTNRRIVLGLLAGAIVAASPLSTGAATPGEMPGAGKETDAPFAENDGVQQEIETQLEERRREMIHEAHSALDETHRALQALDAGDSKAALDALAKATGQLELLVVREPSLALAPIEIDVATHDLYATPGAIRAAREQAMDLLEAGAVQEARVLLDGLASEIVIRVTNLPLGTYPEAIKAISLLVDEGEIVEAKSALEAALSTLVVTDHVISLPIVRARSALEEAESLVGERTDLSDDEKGEVAPLVEAARTNVEIAELLGYGKRSDHDRYRKEIKELERKLESDGETRGVFARLRRSLDHFQTSFFE